VRRVILIVIALLAPLASAAPPFASSAHAALNHNQTFLKDVD
jgi:hypothetical protein